MRKSFLSFLAVMMVFAMLGLTGNTLAETAPTANKTYVLEMQKWGIYNDGTHPVETTQGINKALIWANQNGVNEFIVPAGTYLIDKNSRINMVSNITFWLNDRAVIQKETNGLSRYETLYVDRMVRNVTLRGGTYKGDRYTHDYSSGGTHENGYGILVEGGYNITIDSVKAIEFTGDGLCFGTSDNYIRNVSEAQVESGAIDDSGRLIPNSGKIRLKQPLGFTSETFKVVPFFQLSYPQGVSKDSRYDVYFYKGDGTYLSSQKGIRYTYEDVFIPAGASYFRAVFNTASTSGFLVRYDAKVRTHHSVIKNSEFAFNRRQGITIGGVENVLITNNKIHDMSGANPQSGIDLEGGLFLNNNVTIRQNEFYNNAAYDIILYDGTNAVVENNILRSKVVGLSTSTNFYNAVIRNNLFDGAPSLLLHDVIFTNNTVRNTFARFFGPNIIANNNTYMDGTLDLAGSAPFILNISNETIRNTGKMHNSIVVNGQPQHLRNVTVYGPNLVRAITGNGHNDMIFENLRMYDFNASELPAGKYFNCEFRTTTGAAPQANKAGQYLFDRCTFSGKNASLLLVNTAGEFTVQNSTFVTTGTGETIAIEAAKSVLIQDSKITSMFLNSTSTPVINVKGYWATPAPVDVYKAQFRWNTITTNIAAKGISTVNAGAGAPSYTVENNVLFKARLQLKPNDKSTGNVEQ
ncbi:right-handed parallel beta-helix repeat-containing protein [Paenibacillus swuensis]|nr:right-handed parallel beta-helix repeat-containing protein [Paenibacillus swuensis]